MKKSGFTLVELSIVLVVIGLLVGGILAGQELVNQANIRAQIKQINQYETARMTFHSKYGQNPGDFDKAALYFSDVNYGGNGDGDILYFTTNLMDIPSGMNLIIDETLLFWQELSLAGMIEGNYIGMSGTQFLPDAGDAGVSVGDIRPYLSLVGSNIPEAKYSGSCLDLSNADLNFASNFGGFTAYYIVASFITGTTGNKVCRGGTFTPQEAYSIDVKIDDGKPFSGGVSGLDGYDEGGLAYTSPCISGGTDYDLSTSASNCMLWVGFLK